MGIDSNRNKQQQAQRVQQSAELWTEYLRLKAEGKDTVAIRGQILDLEIENIVAEGLFEKPEYTDPFPGV